MSDTVIHFAIISALGLLFICFPGIDLAVSSYLYHTDYNDFYLKGHFWVVAVRKLAFWLMVGFVAGACFLAVWRFWQVRSLNWQYYKKYIYILLVCALGPGLLVHIVIKEQFGRPRPVDTIEFGGNAHFTPVLTKSNACHHDCSFPSGHAAAGFVFFALAFLSANRRYRMGWFAVGILFGLGIGIARIMEGGHFLSDIIFSGIVVYLVAYILERMIAPNKVIGKVRH